ncbi:beta-N-acetylglucosaminidase domain-containing protein [Phenylobacterium sp.]|uniref:beta-N-acetylglucosaminidase domain-containing protein n=1 Tax=Phenylobacterium sp. TaxID=1871053 RepID=UPI002E34E03E|nr:beta-N-acetylglucosaminidase domain-containing protein [Phenylobacterium sp.]HEX4709429.1 beta-N-acetylglucosaminidase domain-containing protein [Phenylobacterium sp.]
MIPPLGTIEGFFGRPYSWAERTALMRFLQPHGYGFYLYAPKADTFLRRRWREPHPAEEMAALSAFAADCRAAGVAFGVGLSPFELHFDFTPEAKAALTDKLAAIDSAGCRWLAILFDDMKGDLTDLARRQAEIVAFAAERTKAERLIVTPSYYTDDPLLDRVFGQRPSGYLQDLGAALDPAIDLMWTGEEVCALEFSPGHLARVADEMGRNPFLWDNYPVNDGPRMSRHLHLRAFTGRPAAIGAHIAGHAVNPASQAILSAIPMLTLAAGYARGDDYAYGQAFREAAFAVCGADLAALLLADLGALQDAGLGELSEERRAKLRVRYAAFDHAAAREVVGWLDGAYAITGEDLQTQ